MTGHSDPHKHAVLIVGGGVTGLTLATFLAYHGTECLLVERHPDLLAHPRARGFTPRTMELYRQVGLELLIRQESYARRDHTWTAIRADTLADDDYEAPDEPSTRLSPRSSTSTCAPH